MYHINISIPVALEQSFTYQAEHMIPAGCRVLVPFGERNRKTVGVVLGPGQNDKGMNLKSVLERLDELPAYSPSLLKLAQWMSSYYLYPLGEVLRSMLPASQTKSKATKVFLTEKGELIWRDADHPLHFVLRSLWKRRGSVDLKLWKQRLAALKEVSPTKVSLSGLEKEGLLEKRATQSTNVRRMKDFSEVLTTVTPAEAPQILTPAQKLILDSLVAGGFRQDVHKPFLLHGVTGAGKTELYLQLIDAILREDPSAQILVMVPEIALTPQMTRVFAARFPQQIAVVHSAMAPQDRWEQLTLIRQSQRRILIGPRSAVFAPFASLRLLIVDEEHDSSYKQGAGLSYNGRDVAIVRAAMEKAMVVLGSATPSMESYANAQAGKYQLLTLTERVLGRALPTITLIEPEMKQSYARRLQRTGTPILDLPVDTRILEALRDNHAQGMQSMVLVNRRGYAYYLFSLRERKAVSCPHCSISLTVHQNSSLLRCHYCDYSRQLSLLLRDEDREAYILVGYGSEQMEVFLQEALPGARIQRVDSDAVSQREALPRILESFRSGKIDVLVGTQMLAKGHDFARVTLICILEIDQTLNLPDFRAGEKTFQLMVQASGRAGRDTFPGQVLIQSQKREHPIIQAGIAQDYAAFWKDQEAFRRLHAYPPFARMILFEFSSSKREHLASLTQSIEQWLKATKKAHPDHLAQIQILGPAVPPIEMIRGRLRRTLLLISDDLKNLWALARQLKLGFGSLPGDVHMRIDVDPQSLM